MTSAGYIFAVIGAVYASCQFIRFVSWLDGGFAASDEA